MSDAEASTVSRRIMVGVVGGAAALLIAGLTIVLTSQPTSAKPEFAAQTKKPCGFCHKVHLVGLSRRPAQNLRRTVTSCKGAVTKFS